MIIMIRILHKSENQNSKLIRKNKYLSISSKLIL